MKKVVVFILVLMLLGACNSQSIPTQPTVIPSEVSTEVPTATPSPTATEVPTATPSPSPFVWSCENDPVKDIILDLGIFGTFKTECRVSTEWRQTYERAQRYEMPLSWWDSEVPVSPPPAKKGDTLSFVMPALGFVDFLSSMEYVRDEFGQLISGYELSHNLQILVNGQEYQVIGVPLMPVVGKDREFLIPKGAIVKLIALKDGLGGNQPLNGILDHIHFVRTGPNETVHEETVIDMGLYGTFRPLFNQDTNRWFFAFTEETVIDMGIWKDRKYNMSSKTPIEMLANFLYWENGALMFVMPADGAIFYDKLSFSFGPYPTFATESHQTMEMVAKDTLVVLYVNRCADINDFYIDFVN